MHPYVDMVDEHFMAHARGHNLVVNAWTSLEETAGAIASLIRLGVDGVITRTRSGRWRSVADEYLTIDGSQDLAIRRRLADRLVEMATEPGGVSVVPEQIEEVPVTVFTPERATGGTIVHAHGGHSMCSLLSHHRLGAHLALRTARRVALVGYRRTPEYHWMAAIENVITVTRAQAADHLTRVDVTLHVEPGVQHAWHLAAGNLPEADRALSAVGTHLDRIASGGHRHQ